MTLLLVTTLQTQNLIYFFDNYKAITSTVTQRMIFSRFADKPVTVFDKNLNFCLSQIRLEGPGKKKLIGFPWLSASFI